MGTRRFVPVLPVAAASAALLLGGIPLAQGGDAADVSKAKRCKRGEVRLTVSKGRVNTQRRRRARAVCVRVPRPGADDIVRSDEANSLLRSRPFLPRNRSARRILKLRALRTGVDLLDARFAALLASPPPVARSRRAERVTETGTRTTEGGSESASRTSPDGDEIGSEAYAELVAERADGFRGVKGAGTKTFVDRCPDAEGRLPGEAGLRDVVEVSLARSGLRLTRRVDVQLEAPLEAHVGDDARLRDFEYSGDGTLEVTSRLEVAATGRRIAHIPTRTYRWTLSESGLDPRSPHPDTGDARLANFTARGPKGAVGGAVLSDVLEWAFGLAYDTRANAAQQFLVAEQGFFDRAECLRAEFSPPDATLSPSQSQGVEASVRHALENVELRMHLRASAYTPSVFGATAGAVTPAEADANPGAPAQFTYTAPGERPPGGARPGFEVDGTSKRGRVRGVWSHSVPEGFPRAFEGSVSGSRITSEVTETWSSNNVVYEIDPAFGGFPIYQLTAGNMGWELNGILPGPCTVSADATLNLGGSPDGFDVSQPPSGQIALSDDGSMYSLSGSYDKEVPGSSSCEPDATFKPFAPFVDSGTQRPVGPGGELAGSRDQGDVHWEWSLSPVP